MSDSRKEIDEVSGLLRAKLGVGGRSLSGQMRRARRNLPFALRGAADDLVQVEAMAEHPRLRLLVDGVNTRRASKKLQKHLKAVDVADRRKGWLLDGMTSFVFNALLMVLIFVVLLIWSGYL